ncbi:aldehyde dehydrogenase [Rhodococcus opacus]|uniref:aldehyde dehydrogenase n=1 Tax=Rhodococcus opacus TaxID=37919 RepID=UPI00146EACEC|nr:aldehyde dehydrogenase [Rhodococcus opacus]MDV7089342.1 aldehyde dehydrogenase [Rhodococcus opacus]
MSTRRNPLYIDGQWTTSKSEDIFDVREAATEEIIGQVTLANDEDVDRAVTSARQAQNNGPWSYYSNKVRAQHIRRFADELEARSNVTASLVSQENGMPISLSRVSNGSAPAAILRMYSDMIENVAIEDVRPSSNGSTIVRREPIGVVGAITPWNSPQMIAMMKIAPALAMGCTIVLKPSPETSLDAFALGEAASAAGLPSGVLNIVPGDHRTGSILVSNPEVDKISFTGSTTAGRIIGAECGRLIRACTLELGGKSASLVLEDADLEVFVAGLAASSFRNNGQVCVLQSRILAPRHRYQEVVDAVADYARTLSVGNPLDPDVTCGPLVSEVQRSRVLTHIENARSDGATLVTGGGRPSGHKYGWFVEPTVFADVTNDHAIAREEVFGPVVAIIPYGDEEEAIRIANDSSYGLAGSVWTSDEDRGLEVCRRIRTGSIGINYYALDTGAPFGGMKESGLGRELGPESLESYTEYKSIYASPRYLTTT